MAKPSKPSKPKLELPPFPPLEWDNGSWEGKIVLRSWRGFQVRQGAYGTVSSNKPSNGTACLNVIALDDELALPTTEQTAACQYLLDHQEAIQSAVLQKIFDGYPDLRASYGYDEEEAQEIMPDLVRPEQLKRFIGLSTVHLLSVAWDGVAYIGFEFGCTWDDEHGLGVMTHQKRIIEIGGADTAFLEWIAEGDMKACKKKEKKSRRS